jgi:predicted nuclease with TOPRIM domain
MNKALIEKAFEKWLEDYKSRSRCTHLDAFAGGATWQREQLEERIKELEEENFTLTKMENEETKELKAKVKQLEAEIKELKFAYDTSHNADQFLIKTARTKLIQELREAKDIISNLIQVMPPENDESLLCSCSLDKCADENIRCCDCDKSISPDKVIEQAEQFLAKLDLLEGDK